ncbi:hypothetical protein [Arenimonas alkanexedens]
MTSAVQICSNALVMLGDKTVASFNEDPDRVTVVSNLWPLVRLSVLRAHPWNSACKRVVLSPDAAGPAFGPWTYQFTVPGDFVRVNSVGIDGCEDPYMLEGRKLLMDTSICHLRYVFDQEDPSQWDSLLVDVMTYAMAARAAYAITGSTSLAEAMAGQFQNMLKTAKAVDGQENPPETLGNFRFQQVRG